MSDPRQRRSDYAYFQPMTTRWMDNDAYRHVNNAVYYSFFDTVANNYLLEHGVLDIGRSPVVGFIVASSCNYRRPIAYPAKIDAAFRVNRIGTSSVEYGVAVFEQDADEAAAFGTYTHVFVERESGKSVPIPPEIRTVLEKALVAA
ncbi:MAG: acyl-CoA thioesterase [Gammaproteobacteria bacterium]|nr:acyl-CoA thioesterase [Gammaproteobacteria bacterium]